MRTYTGQGRPTECVHGNRFQTEAELNRKPRAPLARVSEKRKAEIAAGTAPTPKRKPLKRGRGFQASPAQQAKVEGLVCLVCGADYYEVEIHPAHVYPRRLATCSCADGVVPLCASCHGRYDDQNDPFDLMPALIRSGYQAEIVHAFVEHEAPMGEVLRIITGTEWAPAELGAAA